MLIALVVFGLLAFLFSLGIVLSKSLLRSVAMLALAAFSSAILLYLIGASAIAALQLLVLVGGLSTYFMLSIAAEEKEKESRRMQLGYLGLSIAMALLLCFAFYLPSLGVSLSGINVGKLVNSSFSSYYLLLYSVVLLLFFVAVASAIAIKHMRRQYA
ncbi:MAG: NADH-quinone oxidoreductase subunit J [Candidatus Micrarchaeia archaeon]